MNLVVILGAYVLYAQPNLVSCGRFSKRRLQWASRCQEQRSNPAQNILKYVGEGRELRCEMFGTMVTPRMVPPRFGGAWG